MEAELQIKPEEQEISVEEFTEEWNLVGNFS
jgi:hypothetical protein